MSEGKPATAPQTAASVAPSRLERLRRWAHGRRALAVLAFAGILAAVGAGAVANALAERRLGRVRADFDMLAKAINGYGIDRCGGYMPPDTSERRKTDPATPLTFELQVGYMEKKPVGTDHKPREFWCPLTSPVAYAATIPRDPFSDGPYGYTCWNFHDGYMPVGVVHSPGPDGRADWPPETIRADFERLFRVSRGQQFGGGLPSEAAVIRRMVQAHLYDPTNGTRGGGDLVAVISSYGMTGWITRPSPPDGSRLDDSEIPATFADPATSDSVAPGWIPGDPMPPAQHAEAYIAREREVRLPVALLNFIGEADLRASGSMSLDLARLDPQRARLGRDFAGFFEHPRLLDRAEELSLAGWQATQPLWWQPMERMANSPQLNFNYSLSAAHLYNLMPLYGKSQLLLAAYDATLGSRERARERVRHLQGTLESLRKENPNPADPYQRRVHDELGRLCAELDTKIGS
jgi:hypothetical protein